MNIQNVFLMSFFLEVHHMLQELWAIFPFIRQSKTFSEIIVFPSAIVEWKNWDPSLTNSKSISVFKEKILNFIRLSPSSFFDCYNPKKIKRIARLRLGQIHLREHNSDSFQDTINHLCNWSRYWVLYPFFPPLSILY